MLGNNIPFTQYLSGIGLSFVCLFHQAAELQAQDPLTISHAPISCLSTDDFVAITASIQSGADLRTAKVYFRADAYPDFYFVEMARVGENYQAYLPLPDDEIRRVVYYIEAVDTAFNSNRTAEHDPRVMGTRQCRDDDPLAAWFVGDSPNIIVGAVRSGLTALPPGFQAAGIAGFVSSGTAGGGPGVWAAVGAAAGAGATVGVLASQNKEPTSTTSSIIADPQPTTTSFPTTSTVPPTPTTTSSVGPTTTSTSTVPPPGPSTTTTSVATALTACFTVKDGDGAAGCKVDFDASCSTGDIVSYTWWFSNNPPVEITITEAETSYDWTDDPECGTPFAKLVRLTVNGQGGATARTQENINPTSPSGLKTMEESIGPVHTSFTSVLNPPISGGRIEAQVVSNGNQIVVTDNATPYRHQMTGRAGRNTIEVYITSALQNPTMMQLDFSGSEHFVPGSLSTESGSVMMQSSHSVVLRLNGAPGERIKLTFQLLKKW